MSKKPMYSAFHDKVFLEFVLNNLDFYLPDDDDNHRMAVHLKVPTKICKTVDSFLIERNISRTQLIVSYFKLIASYYHGKRVK